MTSISPHVRTIQTSATRVGIPSLVRVALGCLLILAALLKTQEYLQAPPLAGRVWTILEVLSEWFLGLWLISGLYRRSAWGVALAAFAGLAMIAGWKGFHGESSCGCFGAWQVNPWLTLGVDIAAVAGLLATGKSVLVGKAVRLQRITLWPVISLGLLIGVAGAIYLATRPAIGLSPAGQMAAAAPVNSAGPASIPTSAAASPITPAPQIAKEHLVESLAYVAPKDERALSFLIVNPTDHPMKIVKIERECSCVHFPESLSAVAPYGSLPIEARFVAPDIHEHYTKHVVLFTDRPKAQPIVLQVVADVGLPLRAEPPELEPKASEPDTNFALINDGDQPIRILYAIANVRGITLAAPRQAVLANGKMRLKLHVEWASLPKDVREFSLRLQTDFAQQPVLEIHGNLPLAGKVP